MVLPLRMSTNAFAMTWADADGVDEMPETLFVPAWAQDEQALARRYLEAAAELDPVIGADRADFLFELAAVYRSLATAPSEYRARIQRADGSGFGVLVACHGRRGFRAIIDGDQVQIESVNPGPELLVEVLPSCPPARIPSATARIDALAATTDNAVLHAALEQPSTDVRALRGLLAGTPAAQGQLTVAARTADGRKRIHPDAVNYADRDDGRVVYFRDGRYLTAVPGTAAAMIDRLARLQADLV